MSAGNALFEELQNFIVGVAGPLSESIRFDKQNKFDFSVMTFYCSILEKAWSVLALVDRQLGANALPILRSQLDTFVDLKNLISDPDYLKHLELRQLRTRKDHFVAAKTGNPYLAQIAKGFDLEVELSILGQEIRELEARGAKIMEPSKKMKLAGLDAEHKGLYSHLSDNSHGGLGAMISRHFREVGDDFEVVAFPEENKDECVATMQTSFDLVLRASSLVHSHFETSKESIFDEMIVEHHKRQGEQ